MISPTTTAPRITFHRHHNDKYIDEVVISTAGGAQIHAKVANRYKTSGMSGDEWRFCVAVRFLLREREVAATTVRDFDALAQALPFLFMDQGIDLEETDGEPTPETQTVTQMKRKGHVVAATRWPSITHAVMAFGWEWLTSRTRISDEEGAWRFLPDNVDHALCFQVGCAEPAVAEYRLRALYSREGYKEELDLRRRDYRRRFCLRHAQRGDCGLEDADRNYEKIGEVGPEHARGFGADVRESAAVIIDAEPHPEAGGEAN